MRDLADETGWGGRVAIGHGNKYSCLPAQELEALGKRLAKSGVAVAVLPTTDLVFTKPGAILEHNVIRGITRTPIRSSRRERTARSRPTTF